MSLATHSVENVEEVSLYRRPWHIAGWELIKKHQLGAFGGLLVFAMAFMAVFANYLAPHDP